MEKKKIGTRSRTRVKALKIRLERNGLLRHTSGETKITSFFFLYYRREEKEKKRKNKLKLKEEERIRNIGKARCSNIILLNKLLNY